MDPELTSLLFNATMADLGIVVKTSDPEKLRQLLYRARKTEPQFSNLTFLISPDNPASELWIINKPEPNNGKE